MTPDLEPIYAVIGSRILQTRRACGVTQQALGDAIGHTRASIANMEGGKQRIPIHVLFDIAVALDVEPGALIPGKRGKLHPAPPSSPRERFDAAIKDLRRAWEEK